MERKWGEGYDHVAFLFLFFFYCFSYVNCCHMLLPNSAA